MFDAAAMGARIRQLRTAKKMTQEELAQRLGLSVSFVGHIERGNRLASLETLVSMSEALDVSTDYLLKGVEGIRLSLSEYRTLRDVKRVFDKGEWLAGLNDAEDEEE